MTFTATKNLIAENPWIYNIVLLTVQYSYIFHLVYMRTLILHSRAAIFGKRTDAYFPINVQGMDCLECCGAVAALPRNRRSVGACTFSKLFCIIPS